MRARRLVITRSRSPAKHSTFEMRSNLSQMLKSVRASSGMNQVQLASKLGVAAPNIARLEAGKSIPSIVTLDAFCTACGFELNVTAEKKNAGQSGAISQPVQDSATT